MQHLFAGHFVSFLIWNAVQGALFGALLTSIVPRLAHHEPGTSLRLFDRSQCDTCGRKLALWETTPILGFLFVRGRCRSCGGRAPAIYPLLELYGLFAGVAAAVLYGPSLTGYLMAWVMTWLIGLAILNWKSRRLANAMTVPFMATGLLVALSGTGAVPIREAVMAGASGMAMMLALDGAQWTWSDGGGRGRSHGFLAAGVGLWLGFHGLIAAIIGGFAVAAARLAAWPTAGGGTSGEMQCLQPGIGMALGAVLAAVLL